MNKDSVPAHESARRRFLLLDARTVEDAQNAELALGTVSKYGGNPLFGEDQPWEMRFDNLYANVIYDDNEQLYKCWYSPFIVDNSSKGMTSQQRTQVKYRAPHNREMAICYATSEDGLAWVKPELALVEYDGSKANNILWRGGGNTRALRAGPHGAGIFKDLRDPDPARRYKAFLKSEILSVAFSADGVHWQPPIACPEANSAGDTHNNAFWAPTLGEYVGVTRQWRRNPFRRQVARTSSVDFINWTETEIALEGLDENDQTYAMPVFFHGGVYIGLVSIHDQRSDRVWVELTWSPDTKEWHRVLPGVPLIPNGDDGTHDWGCVYAAACPVFLENEIRLYYGGSDGLHTSWRNGFFCLATLRPDGFAGYRASDVAEPATVTTTPVFAGDAPLRVSADIAEGGELAVRVLGDGNQVLAQSQPITSTVSDTQVRWLDDSALDTIRTKPARLQFVFRKATVYSFLLPCNKSTTH